MNIHRAINHPVTGASALAAIIGALGLLCAGVLPIQAQATTTSQPLVVLPRYDADAALERYFQVDLASGDTFVIDRVRRDPLSTRRTRLGQNLHQLIGRPVEPPPVVGEIMLAPLHGGDDSVRSALLVESSTGYVAYFDDLGKNNRLGTIRTTSGRPFGDIVAPDGNFALLMRRTGSGRTVDAILYHATTGKARALRNIEKLPTEPKAVTVSGLPILTGRVAAVPLQREGGGTGRLPLARQRER